MDEKKLSTSRLSDFNYRDELGFFVHPADDSVDYSDGGENYIIDTLGMVNDLSSYSQELIGYIKDWPSRYHFSYRRHNLLNGIDELFNKDDRVLEIGSGCGAISRWLGEHFSEVDTIEGSLSRTVATRARTKDLKNVNVYCGNILSTEFDKKYDMATLIGVLEYLPFYDPGGASPKETCRKFLKRLSNSLEDDGVLVLAIENKLGAKYFSGCREDHTGKEFDGLSDYPEKSPVTFSRNELEEILHDAGFTSLQFYHLYPDYKLAETLIAEFDEVLSLRPYNWVRTPFEDYLGERLYLMPEALLLKTLTDSRLLWHFSNSFLVVASKSDARNLKTKWLIKKFYNHEISHDRKFHHRIALNRADTGYVVERRPIADGKPYLNLPEVVFSLEDMEYIAGDLLSFQLYKALLNDDPKTTIRSLVKDLYGLLIHDHFTGRYDNENYALLKGTSIDFTFWNLITPDGSKCYFIDHKWAINKDIPVDFVLFRALYHIYGSIAPFLFEKDRAAFIIGTISCVCPNYSRDRLNRDLKLEEDFQSVVHNRKIELSIDYPAVYSVSDQARLNREMISMMALPNESIKGDLSGTILRSLKKDLCDLQARYQGLESKIRSDEQLASKKDDKIKELDAKVSEYVNKIRAQNDQLAEASQRSLTLEYEIEGMKRSVIWQVTMKYHNGIVERFLKPGTRLRGAYDLMLRGARVLVREGPLRFWYKFNEYRGVKKHEHTIDHTVSLPDLNVNIAGHVEDVETIDKNISVVIPTRNAGPEFEYTLEKIRNQKGVKSIEIIIVDSGSTDDTLKIAERYGSRVYSIKPEEFNHGMTRNYGAEKVTGDHILFTVQDALPIGDLWIYHMLKAMENDDTIAAVTCRQLPKSSADLFACFSLWYHYKALNFNKNQVSAMRPDMENMSSLEIRKHCGLEDVCCLIKKDVFDQFKFKDIQYAEDLELGLRVLKGDHKIAFLYSVGVIHSHNRGPSYFIKRNYVDNKMLPGILTPGRKRYPVNADVREVTGDIRNLYGSLNASIESLSALPFNECGDSIILKLKSLITDNLKKGPTELDGFKGRSRDLDLLLEEILVGAGAASPNNRIAGQYFDLLDAFGEYLRSYESLESKKEEFLDSAYKLFAIIAGAELAGCYMSRQGDEPANDVSLALDALLSEGV